MPIHRLDHAVLFVRDAERSVAFYCDVLGFRSVFGIDGRAASFRAEGSTNDRDLAVMAVGEQADDSPAGSTAVGLYHLAWEIDILAAAGRRRPRPAYRPAAPARHRSCRCTIRSRPHGWTGRVAPIDRPGNAKLAR